MKSDPLMSVFKRTVASNQGCNTRDCAMPGMEPAVNGVVGHRLPCAINRRSS